MLPSIAVVSIPPITRYPATSCVVCRFVKPNPPDVTPLSVVVVEEDVAAAAATVVDVVLVAAVESVVEGSEVSAVLIPSWLNPAPLSVVYIPN